LHPYGCLKKTDKGGAPSEIGTSPLFLGLTPLSFFLPKEKILLAHVEIMLWAGNNFWGRILNPYNNSGS
jgi:hypothetical protein